MERFILGLMLLIFLLCTDGCAPRAAYIPVSHNLPHFDSARKLQLNVYPGTNHLEVQAATNPYRHLLTTASINFGSGIAVYDISLGWYGYSRTYKWNYALQAGIGYNTNLYFRDPGNKSLFTKSGNGYEITTLYNRYYMMPSLSFRNPLGYYDIVYGFAFSVRSSCLFFQRFRYREIDAVNTTNPNNPVYVVNKNYRNEYLWVFEPAITHSIRRGPFTIILQLQSISPYSNAIDVRNTKFSPGLLFSGGFQYALSGKKKL